MTIGDHVYNPRLADNGKAYYASTSTAIYFNNGIQPQPSAPPSLIEEDLDLSDVVYPSAFAPSVPSPEHGVTLRKIML